MRELPRMDNFDPGDRTYYVNDERLRAFRQLTPEQRLRWVEELAAFLRMAKIAKEAKQENQKRSWPLLSR